jgi:lipopolysaccharide/colanic/teichoic acid biosynthesis glycosyltransferase
VRMSTTSRNSFASRLLDMLLSAVGLVLFAPLGVIISILIATGDAGPIFFAQERIGRFGRPFRLWKFRTMKVRPPGLDAPITYGSRDPRITRIGYYLRMLKLDEFPQLWNVLRGDMSLVGPRPEVEKYIRLYTEEQRDILKVRPGITDITVIRGHLHDTALLDGRENAEDYYVNVLMPRKVALNLEYVRCRSFWLDLRILVGTILLMLRLRKNVPAMIDDSRRLLNPAVDIRDE